MALLSDQKTRGNIPGTLEKEYETGRNLAEAIDQITASREHNFADMETILSFADRLTKAGFDPVLMALPAWHFSGFIAYT